MTTTRPSSASLTRFMFFVRADTEALGYRNVGTMALLDPIWRHQALMRCIENIPAAGACSFLLRGLVKHLYRRSGVRLGFSISPGTCGPGLELGHYGDVVINAAAVIGERCTIAGSGVLVGVDLYTKQSPVIGDDCYLGPGCKIIGAVTIAQGVTIAANAVVTKSIDEPWITVGGVPAKIISNRSVKDLYKKSQEQSDA